MILMIVFMERKGTKYVLLREKFATQDIPTSWHVTVQKAAEYGSRLICLIVA